MKHKLLTALLSIGLLPSLLFAQNYRLSVDAQDAGSQKVIDRVFTGNTVGLQVSFYDGADPLVVTNWTMRFMYGYGQYDTNGMVSIVGTNASSNVVVFSSQTNVFFSENGSYYFSIVGTNSAGRIRTFARGRMIEEYDPSTGGAGGYPFPMPWGAFEFVTQDWVEEYIRTNEFETEVGYGVSSNTAYRGDWGNSISNSVTNKVAKTGDTMTGDLTMSAASLRLTGTGAYGIYLGAQGAASEPSKPVYLTAVNALGQSVSHQLYAEDGSDGSDLIHYVFGQAETIWDTGNDGSLWKKTDSVTNAVDETARASFSNYLPLAGGTLTGEVLWGSKLSGRAAWINTNGIALKDYAITGDDTIYIRRDFVGGADKQKLYKVHTVIGTETTNLIWTADVDGHTSGMDADTLDTYHASDFVFTSQYFNVTTSGAAKARSLSLGTVVTTNALEYDGTNLTFGGAAIGSGNGSGFPLTNDANAVYAITNASLMQAVTGRFAVVSGNGATITNLAGGTVAQDLTLSQDLIVNGDLLVYGAATNFNWTTVDLRTNVYSGTHYIETNLYTTFYVSLVTNIYETATVTNRVTTIVNVGGTLDALAAEWVRLPQLTISNGTATATGAWDFAGATVTGIGGGTLTNELDPVFTASVAYAVTSGDTSNWSSAYGWGNHADGGYLAASWTNGAEVGSHSAFRVNTTNNDAYVKSIVFPNGSTMSEAGLSDIAPSNLPATVAYVNASNAWSAVQYFPAGTSISNMTTNLPWMAAATIVNSATSTLDFTTASLVDYLNPTQATTMAASVPAGIGIGRKVLIINATTNALTWPTNVWAGAAYFTLSSTTSTVLSASVIQSAQGSNRIELLRWNPAK